MNKDINGPETKFRNDFQNRHSVFRLNLHYYHVTNGHGPRKNGISCEVCHDPHVAMQDHLVRNQIPGRNVTIAYRATERGGTCARSCHASISYKRIE